MSLIRTLGGIAAAAEAPPVGGTPAYSMQTVAANPDFINWTPTSAGRTSIFTISFWFKLDFSHSGVNAYPVRFTDGGTGSDYLEVGSGGWTRFYVTNVAAHNIYMAQLAYDVWHHVLVHMDDTDGTYQGWGDNNFFDRGIPIGFGASMGAPADQSVGRTQVGNVGYDCHFYDVHIVTGSIVPRSSFVVDDQGTLKAVPYSGPWGAHGVNLRFENPSNLGEDSSNNHSPAVNGSPVRTVDVPPRSDA